MANVRNFKIMLVKFNIVEIYISSNYAHMWITT